MTDQISNSISRSKIDGIEVRPTRLEDLKQINDILAQVSFDIGVHILEIYYLHSDRRWRVAVDEKTGKIVAFDSTHTLLANEIVFGFDMFVRKEYQNRGIIRAFGRVYEPTPLVCNATAEAVLYIPHISKFDMKLVGYAGKPELNLLENNEESGLRNFEYSSDQFQKFAPLKISILENQEDMEQVLAYDRSVLDLDRTKFTKAWCAKSESDQPYAKTLLARRESADVVVGFGTLRVYTSYYVISPLYADDQIVAKRLLVEMVKLFDKDCGKQELYVFFDAKNHLMMEFVNQQKFEWCDSEIRHCGRGAEKIKERTKLEKVYALHDYWPV